MPKPGEKEIHKPVSYSRVQGRIASVWILELLFQKLSKPNKIVQLLFAAAIMHTLYM
jgi:hypothetical protein